MAYPTGPSIAAKRLIRSKDMATALTTSTINGTEQTDWSRTKSDDGLGGLSGDLLPGGRAGNHPTRSSLNARGKAGPQVGGKNR
jgi:hypothetical protein